MKKRYPFYFCMYKFFVMESDKNVNAIVKNCMYCAVKNQITNCRNIVGLRILGKGPELSLVSNNETIVASGVPLGMFRVKVKPGNICFNRPGLGLKNIKSTSVCA